MKTAKIFFIALAGVFFSTAAIAQTETTNPKKAFIEDAIKVENVAPEITENKVAQMAEPATDAAPEAKAPAEAKDKDKKKKSAKKSCCSKNKEKATTGCGKKD